MDSTHSSSFTRSQKLTELAQRLRRYMPGSPIFEDDPAQAHSNETGKFKRSERAAVLICIFEDEEKGNDLRVILTKRSSKLSSFSGQVSLPGGRADEIDADDIITALREAEEEIGLDPSLVDVVAVLEPYSTSIPVVPVIGILWDKTAFKAALNASEVEAIFDVSLELFLKDENRREEETQWQGVIHFFEHKVNNKMYVTWGLTAAMLIEVASIVYQRPPAFQVRLPRFWKRNQSRL